MFTFDENKALELIMKETGYGKSLASSVVKQLKAIHPALQPTVLKWLDGVHEDFEFEGLTLSYILEKEKGSYIHSVFVMSTMLKKPHLIDGYKKLEFHRQ